MKVNQWTTKLLVSGLIVVALLVAVGLSTRILVQASEMDAARESSSELVPETAKLKSESKADDTYLFRYVDEATGEIFEVQVDVENPSTIRLSSRLENDFGSSNIVITRDQAISQVLEAFKGVQILSAVLEEEKGVKIYNIAFSTDQIRGLFKINPESGLIVERLVHYGQSMLVLPYQQKDEDDPYDVDQYDDGKDWRSDSGATDPLEIEDSSSISSGSNDSTMIDDVDVMAQATGPSTSSTTGAGTIDEGQVRQIVLAKQPGATIEELELEQEDGRLYFEGQAFANSQVYDFEIDAYTGAILQWEMDDDDDDRDEQPQSDRLISQDRLREIIDGKVPGATILDMELDEDDGRYYYEVDARLGNLDYEFEVDAYTGAVLHWSSNEVDDVDGYDDYDDDDDDDDDDD